MKNLLPKTPTVCLQAAMTVLFAVAVCLFWHRGYVSALAYHEGLQMFLLDFNYIGGLLSLPGGGAVCVAEFLVQFYVYPFVGATIIALLLVAVQLMAWNAMRRVGAVPLLYPLSFVPALFLWRYMGDANVMLTFVVAIVAAQCASWTYSKIGNGVARWLYTLALLPLLYWLIGPVVFACVVIDAETDFRRGGNRGSSWLKAVARAIVALASVLATQYFVQYPLGRIMEGLSYFRFPTKVPTMQHVVVVVVAFSPLLGLCGQRLCRLKANVRRIAATVLTAIVAFFCLLYVPTGFNAVTYELMDYDYLVRTFQWEKIISKANKKQPSAPMSVACLNLALSKKGQLSDNMFAYYQNGGEGLLPVFSRDFISPLSTAEAYLSLGMINTAQRFIFEAQEAIPNFNKSARMTKRLAQTNLLNGQYAVAAKYLRMLKKTLFYRSWAKETEKLLWNEGAINADPWYSRLRSLRYTEDFLYSDREMDQMLGLLFVHNNKNKMAFEYLMAYELLQRDLGHFLEYYPLGKYVGYTRIPTSYQEALVFTWLRNHRDFNGMPWSIERQTASTMVEFAQRYSADRADPMLQAGWLGRSYWNYYLRAVKEQ